MPTLLNSITETHNARIASLSKKISDLNEEKKLEDARYEKAIFILPQLEINFSKCHLCITSFSISPTNGIISISAEPTSSKFKFLSWKGYTSRGACKNEAASTKKAQSLSKKLSVNIDSFSCSVNNYSLSHGQMRTQKNVLVSFNPSK